MGEGDEVDPSARRWAVEGVVAGALALPPSMVASALHARATGRPWQESEMAAGNLVLGASASPARLVRVGAVLRAAVALNWGVVLSRWLDHRHPVVHGAGAGLALFGFQYLLVGRRRPLVRALPAWPQVVDHVVYGTVAGAVLGRLRRRAQRGAPPSPAADPRPRPLP